MDTQELMENILKETDGDATTSGVPLALKMSRVLKRLRKRVKRNSHEFKGTEDEGMWLRENFPHLEQVMREDAGAVVRLKRIQKGERLPRFFEFFTLVLTKSVPKTKEDLDKVFSLCNGGEKGIDYNNCLSLILLFRSAAELRLCEIFLSLFDGREMVGNSDISALFGLIELLLTIPSELALKSNNIEKCLLSEGSKIYPCLSQDTKESFRKNLSKLAKRKRKPQLEFAMETVKRCGEKGEHIGAVLSDRAEGGLNYLLVLLFLTICFTLLLCLVSPLFVLFIVPIYYSTSLVLDKFFSKYIIKPFVLPQIKLDKIPDGQGVMTVITTLFLGEEENQKIYDSLEKSYFSCGGENVYFGVLADLCDSDERFAEKDGQILEKANAQIRKLRGKYGDCFFLFVRERAWSEGEESYIAPERKRGAVCSLASFLCGENDDFTMYSIKPSNEKCKNIRYILTLDADTNLGFDCIKPLVGIAMQEQNVPVFDEKRSCVTKGYGIIQPQISTTIDSSSKNYFTKIMCGHAGIDNYSFGGSDKNMSLFGQSFFCGKGLIEKNVFYKAFCGENRLQNETILSHDAVEGAILRCAFTNEVCFTDSYPSNMLSYFKRKHRWMRGDIQNKPFLFSRIKGSEGRKFGHSLFSRFFILQNIVNSLLPIFCLVAIMISPYLEKTTSVLLMTLALSCLILPCVNAILSLPLFSLWQNVRRILYSRDLYTGIWTSFSQMLFSISALPKSAFVSLDAVVRAQYRSCISHKKQLEWTTFSQSDREAGDGLLGYVKGNIICAVFGALLFLTARGGLLKIVSLMWFFCPYFAYIYSKPQGKKTRLSQIQERQLLKYCHDMWCYFEERVNQNTSHLPPDNVSFIGKPKTANYTSPTNIGFYILCLVIARKMGFIDSKDLEARLTNALCSIERLPKFKGILYNWYDTESALPQIPKYLSSVDVGNYIACLICAKNGLAEFADEMNNYSCLKQRLASLADVDMRPLYDYGRNQFYIGATQENDSISHDKNRYDMLMSEARIISYICVANKSIPVYHLRHLSRPFAESDRHIGLASWSGTAFEYFLPEIFLKSKEGTLLYEANCFSYSLNKLSGVKTKKGRVFGISESLYNELDENGNYKYFAFGTSKNALRVSDERKVISPYSAFLFLPMSVDENLRNLESLKELGCYGKYGFYDSIDFENFGVVKCFMSHHIGMSICAAANELYDGIIRKWFSMDKRMAAAGELLEEKIPYETRVKKISRKIYNIKLGKSQESKKTDEEEPENEKGGATGLCVGRFIYTTFSRDSLGETVLSGRQLLTKNERLIFEGGFDLQKNAKSVSFDNERLIFSGDYCGERYTVNMFCSANEAIKIIRVKSKYKPYLEFDFSDNTRAKIGSGAVFANNRAMVHFCFGIAMKSTEYVGADYAVGEKIRAYFDKNDGQEGEYIFCVGECKEIDEILPIQRHVYENHLKISEACSLFHKSLIVDFSKIPQPLKSSLLQYGYDEKMSVSSFFTDICESDRMFLLVLMLFTDLGADKKTVLEELENDGENELCVLLRCLFFALYITINNDTDIADEMLCGKTAYRVFLERVFTLTKNSNVIQSHSMLFRASVSAFEKACEAVGDGRMAQKMAELINDD